MIQLRYLEECEIDRATREIQSNGAIVNTYAGVDSYLVQKQELTDETSASVYGAKVNRMLRLSSPKHSMEKYLSRLMNSSSDNISKYSVLLDGKRYQIVSVRQNWVDVELL